MREDCWPQFPGLGEDFPKTCKNVGMLQNILNNDAKYCFQVGGNVDSLKSQLAFPSLFWGTFWHIVLGSFSIPFPPPPLPIICQSSFNFRSVLYHKHARVVSPRPLNTPPPWAILKGNSLYQRRWGVSGGPQHVYGYAQKSSTGGGAGAHQYMPLYVSMMFQNVCVIL